MASPCNKCLFYDKQYDNFRQEYDDIIVLGNNQPEAHYCPMYLDNIPNAIFYDGAKCEFFEPAKQQ